MVYKRITRGSKNIAEREDSDGRTQPGTRALSEYQDSQAGFQSSFDLEVESSDSESEYDSKVCGVATKCSATQLEENPSEKDDEVINEYMSNLGKPTNVEKVRNQPCRNPRTRLGKQPRGQVHPAYRTPSSEFGRESPDAPAERKHSDECKVNGNTLPASSQILSAQCKPLPFKEPIEKKPRKEDQSPNVRRARTASMDSSITSPIKKHMETLRYSQRSRGRRTFLVAVCRFLPH